MAERPPAEKREYVVLKSVTKGSGDGSVAYETENLKRYLQKMHKRSQLHAPSHACVFRTVG